ncbi:MAG: ligase-associated DNA damage response exonuclease [Planctomycetota bacterium]
MIRSTAAGAFCERGDFFLDPGRSVERAVITHAHRDHLRNGCSTYYCSEPSEGLVRARLPRHAKVTVVPYGEVFRLGDVDVSFHPAGHILGSSQVRIESEGKVWVFSGDYKRDSDASCEAFEVVECDTFITESTFGRSEFAWPRVETVFDDLLAWWKRNRELGRTSVIFCYVLGKAQRILAELKSRSTPRIWVHDEIEVMTDCYRRESVPLASTELLPRRLRGRTLAGELVLAPPRYAVPTWIDRFQEASTAVTSGWADARPGRGGVEPEARFPLSDHADWPALLRTIEETGARRVLTMHGESTELVDELRSRGLEAGPLSEVL